MENPFKQRQYRDDPRGSGPEAEANEAAWKRVQALYDAVLKGSKDPISTRVAINTFLEKMATVYGKEVVARSKLANLLRGAAGSGEALDLPNNEIQHFLDSQLLESIDKKGAA